MKKSFQNFFLSFALLLFANCSDGQTDNSTGIDSKDTIMIKTVNQFDENGLRSGLWIENKGIRTYTYYKDNKKNGIFVSYHRNGNIYGVGKYKNDKPADIWFSFNSEGFLVFERSQIEFINTNKVFKYKSLLKEYYESGFLKSEGVILSVEDFEIDFIKIGIWKYYNKIGIIIKTEKYINGVKFE